MQWGFNSHSVNLAAGLFCSAYIGKTKCNSPAALETHGQMVGWEMFNVYSAFNNVLFLVQSHSKYTIC